MSEASSGTGDEFQMVEESPRERRPHFSKDLWVALALLAAVSGVVILAFNRALHQHKLVERVRSVGGKVAHSWEWANGQILADRSAPLWTELMARIPSGREFCTRVVFVNLSGSENAGEAMSALGQLSDLRSLDLSLTSVSGDDFRYLQSLTELEELNLSMTPVADSEVEHLENLNSLLNLNLAGTTLTDVGLSYLSDLSNLERLDLSQTGITDPGLKALAKLTQLDSLTLDGTDITDAGLAHLSGLTSLRRLSIKYTRTTEDGIARLKKQLRGLKVINSE
jgi:Leucine rich repeat